MPSTRGIVQKNDPKLAEHVERVVVGELKGYIEKNQISEAIDIVHDYERKLRLTEDYKSLSLLFATLTSGIFKLRQPFKILDELEYFIKKKHSLRPALETLVNEIASSYPNYFDDNSELEKFLNRFINVTEGKLYAERPRSQAITFLSKIAEDKQDFVKAKELLLITHIETISSLDYHSKTQFILEQMRLCLKCKDMNRMDLISKKMNQKFITEPENEELLITFYHYMTQASIVNREFTDCLTYFNKLYNCQTIQKDNHRKLIMMKLIISTAILSDSGKTSYSILRELKKDEDIASIPLHLQLLNLYVSNQMIQKSYFDETFLHTVFLKDDEPLIKMLDSESIGEIMKLVDKQLRKRNIYVMAFYSTSMTLRRAAELLECSEDEAEDLLVEMIVNNRIECLINRLDEISIEFGNQKNRPAKHIASSLDNSLDLDRNDTKQRHKKADSLIDDYCSRIFELNSEISDTINMIKNEEMIESMN
ncbi:MAG: 26S proteasome non-ATPase regulatory subunit 12 [Marteilia pararefringens]